MTDLTRDQAYQTLREAGYFPVLITRCETSGSLEGVISVTWDVTGYDDGIEQVCTGSTLREAVDSVQGEQP